jgi:hypothetical protein
VVLADAAGHLLKEPRRWVQYPPSAGLQALVGLIVEEGTFTLVFALMSAWSAWTVPILHCSNFTETHSHGQHQEHCAPWKLPCVNEKHFTGRKMVAAVQAHHLGPDLFLLPELS